MTETKFCFSLEKVRGIFRDCVVLRYYTINRRDVANPTQTKKGFLLEKELRKTGLRFKIQVQ